MTKENTLPDRVSVPREPTDEMLIAAMEATLAFFEAEGIDRNSPFEDYPRPQDQLRRTWAAMLSASPLDSSLVEERDALKAEVERLRGAMDSGRGREARAFFERDNALSVLKVAGEALDRAQNSLAMLTEPNAIKTSSVQHAWAQAVAAERSVRSALTSIRKITPGAQQ